jgi:hypothetical protein
MCKHEKTALVKGWLPLEELRQSLTSRGYLIVTLS